LVGEKKNGDASVGDGSPPMVVLGEFGEKSGPSVPGNPGVGRENGVNGKIGRAHV
jgi:hypothetical protein